MQAGKLRKQVVIQQKAQVSDGAGGYTTTWSTFATVRAEINDVSGGELVRAGQAQSEFTTRINIRYVAGVKAAMRVVHGSNTYEILHVNNRFGRDRELELMCKRFENG